MENIQKLSAKVAKKIGFTFLFGIVGSAFVQASAAQTPAAPVANVANYTAFPPLLEKRDINPLVMLTLSGDHQLFMKAYNDYDDLNDNKQLDIEETTYNPNAHYIGYFDSAKCYFYQSHGALNYFEPTQNAPVYSHSGPRGAFTASKAQYCPETNEWSGNFLNWVTMTRMDIVRHILYGGYRYIDEPNRTVLERAFLPNDAHSFAKFYGGRDVHLLTPFTSNENENALSVTSGYTFCNTTLGQPGVLSQANTNPPLMRAVKGNYSFWASGERFQCLYGHANENGKEFRVWDNGPFGINGNDPSITGIYAYDRNPPVSERGKYGDFHVRVEVCGAYSAGGFHDCKTYGSTKKPVGIIQRYGEERNVDFGLMTRAFNYNKSDSVITGGVLRRNVSKILDEINQSTGQFLNPAESIISALDAWRIVDYEFRPGEHDENYDRHGTYQNCLQSSASFAEGKCRNWGNPFSQILAESYRYFAAADDGPAVTGDADSGVLGLSAAQWKDPLPADAEKAACVNFNIIGFNASAGSFDNDTDFANETPSGLGIGNGTQSIRELTNELGVIELGVDNLFFVGSNGQANAAGEGQCTQKAVGNFGDVSGTCPDAPRLKGSYLMAGLAHYAKTNDVRGGQFPGKEFNVNTYGVTMATNLPVITVKSADGSQSAQIIPSCRNYGRQNTHVGNCALVDFKPIPMPNETHIRRYFVSWEDTEHGSDYDQDISGIIEYSLTADGFTVTTSILGAATGNNGTYFSTQDEMEFGYVVYGTSTDGLYFENYVNRNVNHHLMTAVTKTFYFTDGEQAKFLEPPLYYAAKWGSYEPVEGVKGPVSDSQWKGSDGRPRGYALVRRPETLQERIEDILRELLNKASTSTSASIESSRLAGDGLMLQALYNPEITVDGNKVEWVGTLNGLFIDAEGNVREDSNGNKYLDVADAHVEFVTTSDKSGQSLKFKRYTLAQDGTLETDGVLRDLEQLKTLWNARDVLANISDANITLQRSSNELAQNKRYIIAGLDQPKGVQARDGQIDGTEVVDFVPNNIPAAVLDVESIQAANVVNFIRGQEVSGYRSRTIDWGNGSKVWRLGDIVHSTPAIVGRPADGYDVRYGDDSYSVFREKYRNRRNVVYVGANDGMLHAFNAGFYTSNGYSTQPKENANSFRAHALGSELWAYVPYNLLPHLKWLTQPEYDHVYFVDSKIYTFDVNIFHGPNYNSNTYPHGWGTILVAGMRLGGGEYEVDLGGGETQTLRSAFIIMDITDPEQPPKLIAEVTDAQLGFTLSDVDLVKRRAPNGYGSFLSSLQRNDWHLVFGSGPRGPNGIHEAISDQPAKLFTLDLAEAIEGNISLLPLNADGETKKSYVHGIKSIDWNRDYYDDMIYFGVVGDHDRKQSPPSANLYHGSLKHVSVKNTGVLLADEVSDVLTGTGTNLPFSATPLPIRDRSNNHWVFAGTGKFIVKHDLDLSLQNKYFGIKVNGGLDASGNQTWMRNGSININNLRDVTSDILLLEKDGHVKVSSTDHGVQDLEKYQATLDDRTPPYVGWYRELSGNRASNFTRTAFLNDTLVFTSYSPDTKQCEPVGKSSVYLLDIFTGLPQYKRTGLFEKTDGTGTTIDGKEYKEVGAVDSVLDGLASDPSVINDRVIIQMDTGEIKNIELKVKVPPFRRAWREVPISEIGN